jgi:hypothetical protein
VTIVEIAFAICIISVIGLAWLRMILLTHISGHYPDFYASIGRPSLFGRSFSFLGEVTTFVETNPKDHELVLWLRTTRILYVVVGIAFCLFFIALIRSM